MLNVFCREEEVSENANNVKEEFSVYLEKEEGLEEKISKLQEEDCS